MDLREAPRKKKEPDPQQERAALSVNCAALVLALQFLARASAGPRVLTAWLMRVHDGDDASGVHSERHKAVGQIITGLYRSNICKHNFNIELVCGEVCKEGFTKNVVPKKR